MKGDCKTRMMEEKAQLHGRMIKLDQFINSDKFQSVDDREKRLLIRQLKAMQDYYGALNYRVYYHTVGNWPEDDYMKESPN